VKKVKVCVATAATLVVSSTPAFATVAQQVPEPSAFSFIAGTVVASIVAVRFIRRK
jgi:hypothetical protein